MQLIVGVLAGRSRRAAAHMAICAPPALQIRP
jgi:hypothetical protein